MGWFTRETHSPTLPWWRRWFGNRSENWSDQYLLGRGYRILARNFRCNLGELDRVVRDGKTIVFVEIRSTESRKFDGVAESVNREKQRRLTRLAEYFLKRYRLEKMPARFDVMLLSWPPGDDEPEVRYIAHAFEAAD